MASLFSRKSPAELVRENQRLINRSVRELDRERTILENQEKKIILDIKKQAKNNQWSSVKILAKDLVRTRRFIQKFYQMRAQLQGVGLRLQTMKSNQSIAQAMSGVTKAMKGMNQKINLPAIQKIMMEFEKQNMAMEMKEEMMNDTMDEAFTEEGEEEETDIVVNKVLDEIGITLGQSLSSTPSTNLNQPMSESSIGNMDSELEARLVNLRKA